MTDTLDLIQTRVSEKDQKLQAVINSLKLDVIKVPDELWEVSADHFTGEELPPMEAQRRSLMVMAEQDISKILGIDEDDQKEEQIIDGVKVPPVKWKTKVDDHYHPVDVPDYHSIANRILALRSVMGQRVRNELKQFDQVVVDPETRERFQSDSLKAYIHFIYSQTPQVEDPR